MLHPVLYEELFREVECPYSKLSSASRKVIVLPGILGLHKSKEFLDQLDN
jgi:hypothetical protein